MTVYILVGDITPGLWCNHCMKSSGFTAPLYRLSIDGIGLFGTLRKCMECDNPIL